MSGCAPNSVESDHVKGVFVSRFDVAYGPKPVARYPPDFIAEDQSNRLAIHSMVQLNASKGKQVIVMLTIDDLEAIGIGTLGKLPSLAFYSLIILLGLNAPEDASDKLKDVLSVLVRSNEKILRDGRTDDLLAKEVYEDCCRLFGQDNEQKSAHQTAYPPEVSNMVEKMVEAVSSVVNEDLLVLASTDMHLVWNLKELVGSLDRLSVNLNLTNPTIRLRSLPPAFKNLKSPEEK
ncbi:MAG: hypothetical protein WED05_10295 [Candidatus Atabeyarchaeum deiterrae]